MSSCKGDIGVDVDVHMDIDLDMAVSRSLAPLGAM